MNRLTSFVYLDLYSYWYHRACHKFELPWHYHHHQKGASVEIPCLLESIISGLFIFSGIKGYENLKYLKHFKYTPVCRTTCLAYWTLVSSSHYLGHKLDYSKVFPINKIQIKHLYHHNNPNYNYSIILPFDVIFGTSNLSIK
jgi:sterol desaturase/sphingolipid hydroxylase (fatty acid hydroxylase superfamily)